MRRLILAFDRNHFSESAIRLTKTLNEINTISLLAVFFSEIEYNYTSKHSFSSQSNVTNIDIVDRPSLVSWNPALFEAWCNKNNIQYEIYNGSDNAALFEIKKESQFADLLILGTDLFHQKKGTGVPYEYLKTLLNDIACPVLLVPEHFEYPESTILTYDGSEDSLYAIRQFSYLFPELDNNESLLVYASDDHEGAGPDKDQIEDWIAAQKAIIIVTGTYSQAGLFDKFHKILINDLLSEHHLPVFVAHR